MWAGEENPLRKPPMDLQPSPSPVPAIAKLERQPTWESDNPRAASPLEGRWSSDLGPTPWDASIVGSSAVPATANVALPTQTAEERVKTAAPPTRSDISVSAPVFNGALGPAPWEQQSIPAPVFNATLGPAPWEQDGHNGYHGRPPATAAARMGTAMTNRVATSAPRPMTLNRGFAVSSR